MPVFVIDHLETVHIDDGQIKFLLGELTGLGHHRMAIHQTGQFICHKDLCHMIIVVHAGTDCQRGTEQMSAGEEIVHDGGIGQCDCDHKDHKIFQRIIPAGIQDGKDQHQNDNTKKQYVGHPAKGSILQSPRNIPIGVELRPGTGQRQHRIQRHRNIGDIADQPIPSQRHYIEETHDHHGIDRIAHTHPEGFP